MIKYDDYEVPAGHLTQFDPQPYDIYSEETQTESGAFFIERSRTSVFKILISYRMLDEETAAALSDKLAMLPIPVTFTYMGVERQGNFRLKERPFSTAAVLSDGTYYNISFTLEEM